eukprot:3064781-Rhodomonas_salina.1
MSGADVGRSVPAGRLALHGIKIEDFMKGDVGREGPPDPGRGGAACVAASAGAHQQTAERGVQQGLRSPPALGCSQPSSRGRRKRGVRRTCRIDRARRRSVGAGAGATGHREGGDWSSSQPHMRIQTRSHTCAHAHVQSRGGESG